MKIFKTIIDLQNEIQKLKANGLTIGFVPTMGALHSGHISLVQASVKNCDVSVASIFINPTQFNNPEDFDKYPVTIEQDQEKLVTAGCDILFLPDVKEMYPEKDTRIFDFDGIDLVMEGAFRPGHFNGVAQIVSKLFDAVTPDKAFFGQKDFQQLAIIHKMVEKLNYKVQVIGMPIIREDDGLAMSSRNIRLNDLQRQKATKLSEVLFYTLKMSGKADISDLKNWTREQFQDDPVYDFEYFDIVDSKTLKSVSNWNESNELTACIAVHVGPVRLIDNVVLK